MPLRWPVQAPQGRSQLPREARILKAVDGFTLWMLYKEAERLHLGLGCGAEWLEAHFDEDGPHYLVPEPHEDFWPDRWHCLALIRMRDGEQVRSSVFVRPVAFLDLVENVHHKRQRQLRRRLRALDRDTFLWSVDHVLEQPDCCSGMRWTAHPDGAAAGMA
jgi:hypothetical protein